MNYLGYSWVDMGMNLDEAMDLIRKAVDLRPSDGYIVDSLGWAYYRLGKFDDAVRELERAVSLKPDDPVLNDHLGDAYWRGGRQLEATFQWAHARDMKPDKDVLASVQKKLAEGLPPLDGKTAAEPQNVAPSRPRSNRRSRSRRRASSSFRPNRLRPRRGRGDRAGRLYGAARTIAVVDRRRQARQRHALPGDTQPQPGAARRSGPHRSRPGAEAAGLELRLSAGPPALDAPCHGG